MFNLDMAAEMAAWILSKNGGSMEKVKLNKLMYLSERDCILNCYLPICDDEMICHDYGPVLEQSDAFLEMDLKILMKNRFGCVGLNPT